MADRNILAYEFAHYGPLLQERFKFPNLRTLDTYSDPRDYSILHLTYKEDVADARSALRSEIGCVEIRNLPRYVNNSLYGVLWGRRIGSTKFALKIAEEDVIDHEFRNLINPIRVPSGISGSNVHASGAYIVMPPLLSYIVYELITKWGTGIPDYPSFKIDACAVGFLSASLLVAVEFSRRKKIKDAKRYIDGIAKSQDYRFYSGLMDAELPVHTEVVPEAREFVDGLKSREDEFLSVVWESANARLEEIYARYLQVYKTATV